MKEIEKIIPLSLNFDLASLGIQKEDAVFFDIETTGLSAYHANPYLIGMLYYEGTIGEWKLLQYFSENLSDEPSMLRQFFTFLKAKKQLISFNGEGFDIPFLKTISKQYEIQDCFSSIESIDIFQKLRPGKKLLRLESYRLKRCEEFMGIYREDPYSGGELISVYLDYLKDRDEKKLYSLLLHNEEDLINLPKVLPMLAYSYILSSQTSLIHAERIELPTKDGYCLDLLYQADVSLPKAIDLDLSEIKKSPFSPYECLMNITGNQINLSIRLHEGELKYYYADYQDYYYLPEEDMAIHKSVANFVDKKYRKKATVRTAYQRKTGLFLPELSPVFHPIFSREYKDKLYFVMYNSTLFSDSEKANLYLRDYLKAL